MFDYGKSSRFDRKPGAPESEFDIAGMCFFKSVFPGSRLRVNVVFFSCSVKPDLIFAYPHIPGFTALRYVCDIIVYGNLIALLNFVFGRNLRDIFPSGILRGAYGGFYQIIRAFGSGLIFFSIVGIRIFNPDFLDIERFARPESKPLEFCHLCLGYSREIVTFDNIIGC